MKSSAVSSVNRKVAAAGTTWDSASATPGTTWD
ncbi:MAG: hypothetical protein JWQ95_2008 [Sphaerisporangium sp.]|jgi:hypothetical protein|nr:hypothetical protein [Sphaerisporangium sp.]